MVLALMFELKKRKKHIFYAFYRLFVCNHTNLTAHNVFTSNDAQACSHNHLIWTFIFQYCMCIVHAPKNAFSYTKLQTWKSAPEPGWPAVATQPQSSITVVTASAAVIVVIFGIAIKRSWRNLMEIRLYLSAIFIIHKYSLITSPAPPIFRLLFILCFSHSFGRTFICMYVCQFIHSFIWNGY